MVEEIITALSRFKSLFVIARNSSFTYKGKSVDIKQVAANSACTMCSREASQVRRQVRISGQLIEAATGTHIGRPVRRRLEDVSG